MVARQGKYRPIVVTDIDGVLMRGSTPIEGTASAVHRLRERKVPFACLTNGGGQLESKKVHKMNTSFGEELFDAPHMFMNYSPVRPYLQQYSQKEGIMVITGSLDVTGIVDEMGITNYVTADELYALFHKGDPAPK